MFKQLRFTRLSILIVVVLTMTVTIFPACGGTNDSSPQLSVDHCPWNTETIVTSWKAPVPENTMDGRAISLVLDTKNQPHLVYYNATTEEIRYMSRVNGKWTDERVGHSAGTYSVSIAVDGTGNPSVSYGDGFHYGNLMYAKKSGGSWIVTPVDRGSYAGIENSAWGNAGQYSSIALDKQGNPHISYNDGLTFGTLKYAVRRNETWQSEIVDPGVNGFLLGSTGYDSSLKLDPSGHPHISYRDGNYYGSLMYAEKTGGRWVITKVDTGWDWDNETLQDARGNTGGFTSLSLDRDRNPVIAYYDMKKKSLMNAQRMWPRTEFVNWPTGIPASSSADDTGNYVSLAIDRNDHRHISYYEAATGSLKYYEFDGHPIRILSVDSGGAGRYASLALDSYGEPHIAYYYAGDNSVRYASLAG